MEYSIKDRTYRLRPGDSLHFLASLPHSWKVVGEESSVNLWIMTPPPLGMTEVWRNRGGKG
jgi:quercetin dioxygenase-like cupin family protein